MTTTDRLLVPIDGSEPSLRALALAARLATAQGLSLEVVAVLETPPLEMFTRDGIAWTDVQALEQRVDAEVLRPAVLRLGPEAPPVHAHVEIGHVADRLLDLAEREGVQMVVLGRTGKGPFRRAIEGSVSRALAAHSKVPVTIVP